MALSFPVIFTGTGYIPPATAVNYIPWAIVGFIFQYVIRRRHFSWWTKYNCMHPCPFFSAYPSNSPTDVLAAGLDSGLAISIILIFFCLQYPANGTIGSTNIAKWWGNTVFVNTADGQGLSYYTINGTFGPSKW
jgi:hypothetical protein